MKKLQLVLFILLSGLLFQSCEQQTTEQPPTVEAPSIIISVQEAEDLFKNYGSRRVPVIEEFQNIDEDSVPISPDSELYVQATRSLSVDYKTLKDYLAFIESQAASAKQPISGLRIYFGLYGPKGEYPDSETVFMNPLMEYGKTGEIRDDVSFAIKEIDGKPTAVAVGEILGTFNGSGVKKGGTNLEMNIQDPVQSLAGNKMPLRPPPPPPLDPDYQ